MNSKHFCQFYIEMEKDLRFTWIRKRICDALDVPFPDFDEAFAEKAYQKKLFDFFSSDSPEGTVLFAGCFNVVVEREGRRYL
jgi:hypothetical protein